MTIGTYSGWTNRATWLIYVWMDEEPGLQEHWLDLAKDAGSTYDLAQHIEAHDIEFMPLVGGVYSDLMCTVLVEINWREIAEHIFEEAHY
ncbi:hypothetical protein FE810_15475 [Thalassotalea litorea]|uniref:Uncharacterized protein n=1 Tax=Thalassotalea litorea TaxID=2020715 RepID=A0A5R9IF28_9GAMM|nr:hypothetical protein [Thalassotalea litorea]TLU61220.1 hypothetical protein FE810_15475 [Thalassotalea litorea]